MASRTLTKLCLGCGVEKSLDAYQKCASKRLGVQSRCRDCRLAKAAVYRDANREVLRTKSLEYGAAHRQEKREYHQRTRDERLATQREWRARQDPEVAKARSRAWYAANTEHHRESGRAWAIANAERVREWHANYYRDNRERWVERQARNAEQIRNNARRRRTENPDLPRRHHRARRARKLNQYVEDVHPLVVLERDDGVCGICGRDVDPRDYHIDHVVPLARGGEHSYANVQAAHPRCNRWKNGRLQEELEAA